MPQNAFHYKQTAEHFLTHFAFHVYLFLVVREGGGVPMSVCVCVRVELADAGYTTLLVRDERTRLDNVTSREPPSSLCNTVTTITKCESPSSLHTKKSGLNALLHTLVARAGARSCATRRYGAAV